MTPVNSRGRTGLETVTVTPGITRALLVDGLDDEDAGLNLRLRVGTDNTGHGKRSHGRHGPPTDTARSVRSFFACCCLPLSGARAFAAPSSLYTNGIRRGYAAPRQLYNYL